MTEAIQQAILDWDPWLGGGGVPEVLTGIPRACTSSLLSLLALPEIKILEGARRVGKSTLFYQVIKHLLAQNQKVLYLNFDDEVLSQYTLKEIYYTYLQNDTVDCLFLDEVQHCDSWVHFVRKMYDTHALKQIWVSGSNASLIKLEYKTLLTGRNITLDIHPLSFLEFLSFKDEKNISLPMSSEREAKIIAYFKQYLQQGGFPAVAKHGFYQKELLIDYFEDMLYKGIVAKYEVNPAKIKEAGVYLASHCAKRFSVRGLAKALSIHPNTAKDYLDCFAEFFLFSALHKFDDTLKNQLSTDKKIYAVDTGLAAANAFLFSEDKGRMLENLVYSALKRQKKDIYFHKQKKECDFLVKYGLSITQAIQVCYTLRDPETKQREIEGLMEALLHFKLTSGLILTASEAKTLERVEAGVTYRIDIKPVWKWMLEQELEDQKNGVEPKILD